MSKKGLSFLQYALFLALGGFLVWWSLRKVSARDWEDIKHALHNAHYWLIVPVIIALLSSHYSRAKRWKILMEPLGYQPRISNTFLAVLIGYMANLAVPRLGEVLKCTLLARYEKVPADKLVGTIVAERAFDLICLFIAGTIAVVTQVNVIGSYVSELLSKMVGVKNGHVSYTRIFLMVGIIAAVVILAWYLLKKLSHFSFIQKVNKIILGVWQGLTSVRYVKHKGWFVFHTVFIWSMYLLSVQLGMWAMQETSIYGIKTSLSALTTGSIAMIITPSGIGAYPLFVQETMSLYGLKDSIGLAFGWLMWTVQFFQILLSGFVALVLLPYLNKQKTVHAQA